MVPFVSGQLSFYEDVEVLKFLSIKIWTEVERIFWIVQFFFFCNARSSKYWCVFCILH